MVGSGPSPVKGVAWTLCSALLAAAFLVPWKLATEHGETRTIVLVMLASAATINTLLAPLGRAPSGVGFGRVSWLLSLALAVLTLAGNLASSAAIARISGPLLAVLQRADVIVVALLAWIAIGERFDLRYLLGAAVAAVGVYLVHLGPGEAEARATGVLLGLLSATCFGAMGVLTRKYISRIEPVRVNALRLWMSVAIWFAVYGAPPQPAAFNSRLVLYSALAALFGPGLSRLALMFSARHVEARITALVSLATPLFALGLAWIFLGTWPSGNELLGGLVLMIGIAIPIGALLAPATRPAQEPARDT